MSSSKGQGARGGREQPGSQQAKAKHGSISIGGDHSKGANRCCCQVSKLMVVERARQILIRSAEASNRYRLHTPQELLLYVTCTLYTTKQA
jgi:hypothetical protein